MFDRNLNYWLNKQEIIKNNKSINKDEKKVLIEIAAQHPLKNGREPGIEFKSRLLKAINIFIKEVEKGNEVIFYIPGSIHCITNQNGEKVQDLISLADAGKEYLVKQGIPKELIRANDANELYKGKQGVYNSGDECYVASRLYKYENCNKLISVTSPVQVFRKAMFYNEFGIQPQMYSVPIENTFHNYVGELFWSLYVTTFIDHNWQGDESFLSVLTRMDRCLEYKCNLIEKNTLKNKKIVIPDNILKIEQELLEKYNIAKENMNSKKIGNDILIEIFLSKDNYKKEIESAISLYQNKIKNDKQAVIVTNSKENAIKIYREFYKNNMNLVKIVVKDDISKEYKKGNYLSYYCICPADQVMKKSINSIESGVIPFMITVPSQNDDYVKENFKLYNEIIGKDIIDLSDKSNISSISKEGVIKGLMRQINPKNIK